jgi:protocatechuate 3,4-dioxygenase alpha subunit
VTLPTTPSQTIGPFFSILLPLGSNALVDPDSHGAITIEGTVLDGEGRPVGDALIELWQANGEGTYDHPADGRETTRGFRGYGRSMTDGEGRFCFTTIRPGPVPGYDERIQAPHINVSIFARGLLRRLSTRLYFPGDDHAQELDPVLQSVDAERRGTLVARESQPGRLRFDIRLRGPKETVFFDV